MIKFLKTGRGLNFSASAFLRLKTFIMKINNFYLLIFALFVSYISCKKQSDIPELKERKGILGQAVEWKDTKIKVSNLIKDLSAYPQDIKKRTQLLGIYVNEARVTGDPYYYQASNILADQILVMDPKNFEAKVLKSSVSMSMHQFEDGKKIAEEAMSLNPNNAYIFGMLVDANVELGNYNKAIEYSERMQSLRPSLESYARASYLREIYGDYDGAIKAMNLAVNAGRPGSESAEWARITLGDLYLNIGQPDSAKLIYQTVLQLRPSMVNGHIGLAKVEKIKGNFDSSIQHVEDAIRIQSEANFVSMLAELYRLKGDFAKSKEINKEVLDLLLENEKVNTKDGLKHNGNRELAYSYLANGDLKKSLELAKIDLALRPDNIDANELVAWIYYGMNNPEMALTFSKKSLATGSKNPNYLYKSYLIRKAAGETLRTEELLKMDEIKPYVDPSYKS